MSIISVKRSFYCIRISTCKCMSPLKNSISNQTSAKSPCYVKSIVCSTELPQKKTRRCLCKKSLCSLHFFSCFRICTLFTELMLNPRVQMHMQSDIIIGLLVFCSSTSDLKNNAVLMIKQCFLKLQRVLLKVKFSPLPKHYLFQILVLQMFFQQQQDLTMLQV